MHLNEKALKKIIKINSENQAFMMPDYIADEEQLYQYLMFEKYLFFKGINIDLVKIKKLVEKIYVKKDLYDENWWFFEIGIPRAILEIIVLSKHQWQQKEIKNIIDIILFYNPDFKYNFLKKVKRKVIETTGANRMELMYIHLLIDYFNENVNFDQYIDALEKLLVYTQSEDGFYEDGSFIQHSHIPYTGAYGYVFLKYLNSVLELLNHVVIFSDRLKQFIKNMILNTFLPIMYGNYIIDITSGRSISRKNYDCYQLYLDLYQMITYLSKILNINFDVNAHQVYTLDHMKRYVVKNHGIIAVSLAGDQIHSHEYMNEENKYGLYQSMGSVTYGFKDLYHAHDYYVLMNPLYTPGVTNTLDSIYKVDGKFINTRIAEGLKFKQGILISFGYEDYLTKALICKTYIIYQNQIVVLISAPQSFHTTLYQHEDVEKIEKDNYNFLINRNKYTLYFKSSHLVTHESSIVKKSYFEINGKENKDLIEGKISYGYMKQENEHTNYQMSMDKKMVDFEVICQTFNVHHLKIGDLHFITNFTDKSYNFKDFEFKGVGQIVLHQDEINKNIK